MMVFTKDLCTLTRGIPEPALEKGSVGKCLVIVALLVGSSQVQPERETWVHMGPLLF